LSIGLNYCDDYIPVHPVLNFIEVKRILRYKFTLYIHQNRLAARDLAPTLTGGSYRPRPFPF